MAVLLLTCVVFGGTFGLVFEIIYFENNGDWITPNHLYHDRELNWFGAYFVTILVGIVSPLVFIGKIVWGIYIFFKWLCTVGR